MSFGANKIDGPEVEDRIRRGMKIQSKNHRAERMIDMPRDDADRSLERALQADYTLYHEGIRD